MSAGAQDPGLSSATFLGHKQVAGSEVEHPGCELVPIQDARLSLFCHNAGPYPGVLVYLLYSQIGSELLSLRSE